MSEIQIAWMELIMVGGLGVILILAGLCCGIAAKKKNAACSAVTKGVVVKHSFSGEGRTAPVVEFTAGGRIYTTRKKYNGVRSLRVTGLPNSMEAKAWCRCSTGTPPGYFSWCRCSAGMDLDMNKSGDIMMKYPYNC